MKRKNVTRNALFTSIISLLLCVSMLVGTTFAWFTDEVKSGTNTITAGNLDVELYHGKSKDPASKVDVSTKLFTDTQSAEIELWEPGVVAYTNLKVANDGNLALKYQMALSFSGANTVDGKSLADVLKIALISGGVQGTTREAVLREAQAGSVMSLQDFKKSGTLEENTNSDVFGLVVFWPDDNTNDFDNAFNLNNGKKADDGSAALKIDLGITLFATQLQYEEDSFGSDYDENIWQNAMFVASEEDLISAIAAGETAIMLEDNIALTKALEIPAGTELALNLNGKKISGAFDKNSSAVLTNKGTLTIVGGTIENTTVNGNAAIYNEGTLTLNDGAKIVGAPIADGSYPDYALNNYGKLTVNTGSSITSDRGALYMNNGSDVVINGGNIAVTDALGSRALTAHVIYAYGSNSKLTINDGTFAMNYAAAGGLGASVICPAGATIDVYDGEFTFAGETGNQSGIFQNYMGYGAPVNVYGGTYNDTTVQKNLAAGYKAVKSSGAWAVVPENAIATSKDLIAAINAAADGDTLLLAPGEYDLAFTNDTTFNVDNLIIEGMGNTKLAITSTEVGYGRIQGNKVTFKNITFTSNSKGNAVGATGEATYTNCTFECAKVECASGGKNLTYFNNCEINGTLHTSVDFSSGNTYVTDSKVAKAEYSGAATMYFTKCEIRELISWNMNTVLENCDVANIDMQHMTDGDIVTVTAAADGLAYATSAADPSAKILYDVPADYAEKELVVPEGVTALGNYAFTDNKNVETVTLPSTIEDLGRGFDSNTSVKKVVLNKGLETIAPRAFKATTALKEVVISSTVKTIDDDAFQKTELASITIPANVEYVGAQAFGASKIETVIFEGNPTIQNKAFRNCAALKTVYFNGDDVTFKNTTGEANCWFCHSESSNPNTSDITFHVKNATVAAKVKAAMGKDIEKVEIYIDGVLYKG